MIELKRVKAKNFLSLGDIEVNLSNQGLTVIDGNNEDSQSFDSNGAGKSSILESIVYAIYGKTIRGLTGDDVVNRKEGKDCYVMLDFTVDTSAYRVIRRRKNSGDNSIELHRDRIDITPYSESELNAKLEELLGMPYKVFTSSILYSDKSVKFAASSNAELKSLFDSILQLDFIDDCLEVTKSRIKAYETKMTNITAKLEAVTQQQEVFEGLRVEAKTKFNRDKELQKQDENAFKTQIQTLVEELDNLGEDQKIAEVAMADKQDEIEELEDRIKHSKIQEFRPDPRKAYEEELAHLELELEGLNSDSRKSASKLKLAKEEVATLHTRLTKLENSSALSVGDICPICNRAITKTSLPEETKTLNSRIAELRKEIQELNDSIPQLVTDSNTKLEQAQKVKAQYAELLEKEEKEYTQWKQDYIKWKESSEETKLSTALSKLNREYTSLSSKIASIEQDIKHTTLRLKGKREELAKLSTREIEDGSKIYDKKLEECESSIKVGNSNLAYLASELKGLAFWKEAYGINGMKQSLLDNIVPFLNTKVNKYLGYLSEGTYVEFSTKKLLKSGNTKESFNIEVYSDDTKVDYFSSSGGERKRIDIAIVMAMQDLLALRASNGLNILFMDEVFDALDVTGAENVVKLLTELSKEKTSIFLITHNNDFKSYFSNVITVTKRNGISFIS